MSRSDILRDLFYLIRCQSLRQLHISFRFNLIQLDILFVTCFVDQIVWRIIFFFSSAAELDFLTQLEFMLLTKVTLKYVRAVREIKFIIVFFINQYE